MPEAGGNLTNWPPSTFRGRIYDTIIDTIGATPLVRLARLAARHGVRADIVAKCESFNPLGSVKDRIAAAMVEAAESAGKIRPGKTVLVEPTSGNTGIALAFIAAAKGYRLILAMPDNNSAERQRMLRFLGAELELTPAASGMRGAISRAEHLARTLPDAFILQQFRNPANPETHRRATAEEIWQDSGGAVDVVVSGIGTGGTLTGVGSALKSRKPGLRMVAVEPKESSVLSGGLPGPHKIMGIGAGFVPTNLDVNLIDEVLAINNDAALVTAREAAQIEGISCGISSGAALAAALKLGAREGMADKMIVAILPDAAERYLSTALFDGL